MIWLARHSLICCILRRQILSPIGISQHQGFCKISHPSEQEVLTSKHQLAEKVQKYEQGLGDLGILVWNNDDFLDRWYVTQLGCICSLNSVWKFYPLKSSGLRKRKARCKNCKSASGVTCSWLLSEPASQERCKMNVSFVLLNNEILVLDNSRDKLFPACLHDNCSFIAMMHSSIQFWKVQKKEETLQELQRELCTVPCHNFCHQFVSFSLSSATCQIRVLGRFH